MFATIVILLVTALVLGGLLWAGALVMQGWLYETPNTELYWRAPVVGAALAVFYGLWAVVDCKTGGHCRCIYNVSVSTLKQYDEVKAVVTPLKKDATPEEKKAAEKQFKRVTAAGNRIDYMSVEPDGRLGTVRLTEAPEEIIIEDGGSRSVFEPERDANGKFKREPGQNLHYYDKSGRSIDEGDPGQVQQFHWDWLLWNSLFNVLHLGLWFAGLWLVLRFQWPHALGFAVCIWLAMTLLPLPMMLDYVEKAFHVAT
ncbi:MAG TPA: hypothetical protein VMS17_18135 [Gemmataceae bacterium]|nr:hypothetical protein [Gemmataceae bacterium]